MPFLFIIILIFLSMPEKLFSIERKDDIGGIKTNVGSLLPDKKKSIDKLDFGSDNIEYDINNDLIIATGNVSFKANNQILMADRIFYNSKNNIIFAEGNVYFKDERGNDFYASYLEIDSELNTGLLRDLGVLFKSNALLKSKMIEKKNSSEYKITKAAYTNCKINMDDTPTWQLKATSGVYNSEKETITFYNSWLEIGGVPVFWTPYLHFSNLRFQRKIGLLTPELKNTSTYGNALILPFYVPLSDNQDLTINTFLAISDSPGTSTSMPVVSRDPLAYTAVYKGYIDYGEFNMNAGYATDMVDGQYNWHYFLNANKELTDVWKSKVRVEETSDFRYLNAYDINPKDSAESFLVDQVILDGYYNDNNYTQISGNKYDYINSNFNNNNPYLEDITIQHKYLGDTYDWGRVNATALMSEYFFEDNKNLERGVIKGDYTYYIPSIVGDYKIDATLQSVYYFLNSNSPQLEDNKYTATAFNLTWDYPLLSLLESGNLTITPVAQLTIASHLDKNKNNPVVDSYTWNTTVNNLFNSNHYSGYDIFEDAQNIKYGMEASFVTLDNRGSRLFLGQMQNINYLSEIFGDNQFLNDNNNVYLPDNKSNYYIATEFFLGGFYANYEGILDLNYKNVQDNTTLGYSNQLFGLNYTHSTYNGLDPTIFTYSSVEEATYGGFLRLNQFTTFNFSLLYSSNDNVPTQLRDLNFALRWVNDCLDVTIYTKRSYNEDTRVNSFGLKVKIAGVG